MKGKKRHFLIKRLKEIQIDHPDDDAEGWHEIADSLIIEYINDQEIAEAFRSVPKWYS
jgi:hypothetical protein